MQGASSGEPLIHVGHVTGPVFPRGPDHGLLVQEERAPPRDVAEAAVLERDPEGMHCLGVEVRQETEVQVDDQSKR